MLLTLLSGLVIISVIAALVCAILVIVKMFQKAGAGLGIVGIITCGLGAYIWGWIKSKELNLTKIMLIWTAAIVISTISQLVAAGMLANAAANSPEFQKMIQDAQKNVEQATEDARKAAEEASKQPAVPQQ